MTEDNYPDPYRDCQPLPKEEKSQRCNNCKFKKRFIQEDEQSIFLNICLAGGLEEDPEGYCLATEASEFDGSDCVLFRPHD